MSNYRAQYKLSQDVVRKYADDVRKLETDEYTFKLKLDF